MKVPRKEFMKALQLLYPAMGKGENNTSSNNYSFMTDDRDISYAGATNNSVAVVLPLPFTLEQDFRVPGTLLYQLVKKLKADELEIDLGVDCVFIKTNTPTQSIIQLQDKSKNMLDFLVEIPDTSFKPLPSNFTESLKECYPYCLNDNTSSIIKYVYAHKTSMCSANQSEIVMCDLTGEVDKMFISHKDAAILTNFNLVGYAYQDSFLYFKTDDGAYIAVHPASQLERFPVVFDRDEYTDIELINGMKDFTPEALFALDGMREIRFTDSEVKELKEVLDTCYLFDESDNSVSCMFDGDYVDITITNSRGSHTGRINLSNYVSPFTMRTLPKLLEDIVNRKDLLYVGNGRVIVSNSKLKHLIQVK